MQHQKSRIRAIDVQYQEQELVHLPTYLDRLEPRSYIYFITEQYKFILKELE